MSLDHVLTDAETPSIDQYLALYRAAGFQVAEQTARHQDGLRNGFVSFGPDYLELVWVENEVQFAEGHPKMPELAERLDRAETQIRRAGLPLVRRQAPETGEPMLLVGPGRETASCSRSRGTPPGNGQRSGVRRPARHSRSRRTPLRSLVPPDPALKCTEGTSSNPSGDSAGASTASAADGQLDAAARFSTLIGTNNKRRQHRAPSSRPG